MGASLLACFSIILNALFGRPRGFTLELQSTLTSLGSTEYVPP
jgi:hypothetical protein